MNGSMRLGWVLVGALLATPGWGGSVVFDPPTAAVSAGTPVIVNVTALPQTGSPYNYGSFVFGSNDVAGFDFAYHPDWSNAFGGSPFTPEYNEELGETFYAQQVRVGGYQSGLPLPYPSLALGSLTIDTTDMALGPHVVLVDFTLDGLSKFAYLGEGGSNDPVYGTFSFTIVPEPGTVALAVLGGLALLRRRP